MRQEHGSKQDSKSVLVVDDEPGIVDVLIAVLTEAGYRASGASDGQQALSMLRARPPDLLVLDIEMPVLDGVDTLRAIKVDARLAAVGVVVMSGIPESMVRRRCSGFAAFLRKPFSLDELLDTLSALSNSAPDITVAPTKRQGTAREPRAAPKKKSRRVT